MPVWLIKFNNQFPLRYATWLLCGMGLLLSTLLWLAVDAGGCWYRCSFCWCCWAGATRAKAATRCCATTR